MLAALLAILDETFSAHVSICQRVCGFPAHQVLAIPHRIGVRSPSCEGAGCPTTLLLDKRIGIGFRHPNSSCEAQKFHAQAAPQISIRF